MKYDIILSLTFPNPEEGANKPPKRRFMNKKFSLDHLSFFEFWTAPHQYSLNSLISPPPKIIFILLYLFV